MGEYPFWTLNKGWVEAKDLTIGPQFGSTNFVFLEVKLQSSLLLQGPL